MTLGSSLTTPPPTLPEAEALDLLRRHFGVTGTLTPLTSERDLNFRVTAAGATYVLKLANPAEPADVTDFQTRALLHLAATDLPVPRVIRTLTGATEAVTPQGVLRLLTWLDGHPQHLTPRSPAQAAAMGRMAARLALGLQGFHHPAATHVLQWDIKQAARLRPLLPFVSDDVRPLATETLDRFDRDLSPQLAGLRWQVVHNDLNPHNVLVDPADPARITGVLDFGDMVETPLVCDAAVAASYQIDPATPWASLRHFALAYHAVLPLTPQEQHLLPGLTATRMLTTLAVASARAARYPDNAPYILRNVPAAAAGLTALANTPAQELELPMTTGTMVNAYTPGAGNLTPEDEARIARRSQLLGPAYRLFYETPVHFVRGEGVWLYDTEGRAYLDCYNNVASLGHCHPHVVAATARQSAIYASHTRYLNDTVLDYAEQLLATFPDALGHVMFTCTGSEANDLALRVAFAHTGGTGVIVTENAYHGVTLATSSMSPSLGAGVPLGPHVRTVPAPRDGGRFTADVQAAIDDLTRHGIKPAALLVDTIFSSDGVFADPPGFLKPAAEAIRAAGDCSSPTRCSRGSRARARRCGGFSAMA